MLQYNVNYSWENSAGNGFSFSHRWGGCMVALVEDSKAEEYKKKLEKEFYSCEPAAKGKNISTILFSTLPGSGACVYVK